MLTKEQINKLFDELQALPDGHPRVEEILLKLLSITHL